MHASLIQPRGEGLQPGENVFLRASDDALMGLDFAVDVLAPGESRAYGSKDHETAILVIEGAGEISLDGRSEPFARESWIEEAPAAAHVSLGAEARVTAKSAVHVARLATPNRASFASRLFAQKDVPTEHRGKGLMNDAAYRYVRTVFDRQNSPEEAKLVLGEVVTFPGKWSSYPPHHHAQPEIYYYRFSPKQGYGHGEMGESVFRIREHDLLRIEPGKDHGQCAAPGYHMYYLWGIRHLEGAPYVGFEYDPAHAWLVKS